MKAQHAVPGYAELEWRVMDVRRMELESGGFGVAIDKVSFPLFGRGVLEV